VETRVDYDKYRFESVRDLKGGNALRRRRTLVRLILRALTLTNDFTSFCCLGWGWCGIFVYYRFPVRIARLRSQHPVIPITTSFIVF
jgi:hypothetical protein